MPADSHIPLVYRNLNIAARHKLANVCAKFSVEMLVISYRRDIYLLVTVTQLNISRIYLQGHLLIEGQLFSICHEHMTIIPTV